MITVRRVRADEVDAFRRVRLAALLDTPSAFGSTHAAESQMSDDEWTARTAAWATSDDRAMFLACDGEDVVGLAGLFREEPAPQLISMWTAPSVRRRGVARALVDAVLSWARANGETAVELWVTDGNDAARTLYESMGFAVTGDVAPLPSDPCKDENRMRLELVEQ